MPVTCSSSSKMPRTSQLVVVLPELPATPINVMRFEGSSRYDAAILPAAC